jgi:hypothetical protein
MSEPILGLLVDDEVESCGRGDHRHVSEYGPSPPDQPASVAAPRNNA